MAADIPYWVPIATAFAGSALVGAINFAMRWQDRKSEEKRHIRELVYNSAVEEWKQNSAFAIETLKMKTGKKIAMEPLVTTSSIS
jgi:hypothetical protein